MTSAGLELLICWRRAVGRHMWTLFQHDTECLLGPSDSYSDGTFWSFYMHNIAAKQGLGWHKSGLRLMAQVNKTYTEACVTDDRKFLELSGDGEVLLGLARSPRSPWWYHTQWTRTTAEKHRQCPTFYPSGDVHLEDHLLAILGATHRNHPDHAHSITVQAVGAECPKVASQYAPSQTRCWKFKHYQVKSKATSSTTASIQYMLRCLR